MISFCPKQSKHFCMNHIMRNIALRMYVNNKGADQTAHPRSMIWEPSLLVAYIDFVAKQKNCKYRFSCDTTHYYTSIFVQSFNF